MCTRGSTRPRVAVPRRRAAVPPRTDPLGFGASVGRCHVAFSWPGLDSVRRAGCGLASIAVGRLPARMPSGRPGTNSTKASRTRPQWRQRVVLIMIAPRVWRRWRRWHRSADGRRPGGRPGAATVRFAIVALLAYGLGQRTRSTSFCRTVTTGTPLTSNRTRNWAPRFSRAGTGTSSQLNAGCSVMSTLGTRRPWKRSSFRSPLRSRDERGEDHRVACPRRLRRHHCRHLVPRC